MLKKTVALCIGFVSSFLLSFIIIYSILSFKLKSMNSALILSVFFCIILSIGVCLIQNILFIKKEQKNHTKQLKEQQMHNLINMSDKEFTDSLIRLKQFDCIVCKKNYIVTSSDIYFILRQYSSVTKDQILELIRIKREYTCHNAYCYIIAPIESDASELLQEHNITAIEKQQILELAEFAYTQCDMPVLINNKKNRITKAILYNPKLTGKCYKCSISLIIVSVFTYNRALYIVLASIMIILGTVSYIMRKRDHSNTIF